MNITALNRVDIVPTHTYGDFKLRIGKPLPFGATLVPGGVNFSIYSHHATACTLVLFEKGQAKPYAEIPFPEEFRVGNVFVMIIFDLDFETTEYGYRMEGPFEPREGHRFDRNKILLDPYARVIGGRDVWGQFPDWNNCYQHRARFGFDDFDWKSDHPLVLPNEDLIIYEMHVRGFTRHHTAGVDQPGTFAALREKIPYLKHLGVNCVELMPIFEFDEFENSRVYPRTKEFLLNYWGYSTVGFFAPKAGYAASGGEGGQVDELKALIQDLHQNGIEVFLDVVFNHTAEGDERGPTISFRGIDNQTYYILTPEGRYLNYSGTGNTLNCNHPIVRSLVLDCLRYWVSEYHIDGFRFDLASILGRDSMGNPLPNPPLIETLAYDPVLAGCKLIAEAWDAGGLYQVGSFPDYDGRWSEWNGKYRDDVRRFLRGDRGVIGAMAQRLLGSPDLYRWRGPSSSVNFITCHDGFTLADLFTYNEKHNEANGEDNRDGTNENFSWNCGVEGPTDDEQINALRRRQMKNAIAVLMVSQGVPMLLMGDEVGRTQHGNNNAYCHDNEWNWLDWSLMDRNADMLTFTRRCIAFRAAHPLLRKQDYLTGEDQVGSGYPDISWHGVRAWHPDWSDTSHSLAFLLCGKHAARGGLPPDNYLYVVINMYWESLMFDLPELPSREHVWEERMKWHIFINTGANAPEDSHEPGFEPEVGDQQRMLVGARSVVILVGK
jgi:glycogen operon protein